MEIAKYNDMMAHLTRKRLAEGNDKPQVIPLKKPAEDPLELFKKKSDTLLQASFASTNKDYFNSLIQAEYEKAREAGVSAEDALGFLKEKSQMYRTLAEEGRMQGEPATLGPSYGRENKMIGGRMQFGPGGTNVETGQGFQPGNPGNVQALEKITKEKTALKNKKVEKFVELVEKGNSPLDAQKKVIKLFKLQRKKGSGTPPWVREGKDILVDKGVLEEKERGSVKIIGETEDFRTDRNIKLLSKKTVEPGIKKSTYKNLATGKTFVKYKPLLRGNTVTVSGAGFDTLEQARKTVKDYDAANPKKTAVTLKLEENLRTLFNSKRLAPLLKSGVPDKKYLKVVQDILDLNVSQAEDKLKQLGEAVRPNSNFDVPGIDKINEKKATNISNFYKSKSVSKKVIDQAIGESVGEKSLKNLRGDVQRELPFPGGPETFEVDEAKAKKGSFRLGSKPYSIFGQVIDGRLNQGDKMRYDALLSRLEEDVQKALKGELIRGGKKISPKQAVATYNETATKAENLFNSQKMKNFKPVRIPKITLDSPDKAIANKAAYTKYKRFFDKNYKELGYSFKIPKDLKPIPEIAADLKNTNSSEYKNMIKNVKEIGKKFIKDINKYDEKDLLKIFNNPKFQQFKKFMPRLVSNDDFSERLYASADNIMSDATYVGGGGGEEEQTFAEKNPITTGVGLTVPSAVAVQKAAGVPILKALANIGKYPLKAVGSLPGAMYFAGDTIADRLEEGKSIPDAVIDKEVGIELLFPEAFKRFGPLMMRAARLTTPLGLGITGLGLAKDTYQRAQELKAMSPEERAELARVRDDFSFGEYSGAKDGGIMRTGFADGTFGLDVLKLEDEAFKRALKAFDYYKSTGGKKNFRDYLRQAGERGSQFRADGGRVNFADGPEDPSKRTFMKILGGLASLPIVGRFFDIAKEAPLAKKFFTEVQQLKNTSTQMPEWFPTFLNKFRKEGKAENVFKQEKVAVSKAEYDQAAAEGKLTEGNYFMDPRTPEYIDKNPDHSLYNKLVDTDEVIYTTYTNDKIPGVRVDDMDGNIDVLFENDYSQPVSINYTAPGAKGPETGRMDIFLEGEAKMEPKPKGEFVANDVETYATDPDGGFDTEDVIANSLDDMMEGTTRMMEEYATGKPVKKLSKGEGKVIEGEIRAEQAAERAAEEAAEAADDFD